MQKTHFKKLRNPLYLGSHDLMDDVNKSHDLVVTIKSVSNKNVIGEDGKGEQCMVAELENQKPLILNATNCKTIKKLYGSPFIEDWVGKSVTLYVEKVRAFGDVHDAIRIRPTKPVITLPTFDQTHAQYAAVKAAILSGTKTVADLRQKFAVSDLVEKDLTTKPTDDATNV